jgi:hypothetical protein
MSGEDFHASSWTPAGQGTYARFMRIRVFDCWMHEQDIRDAVDRPGHEDGTPAEVAMDEIAEVLGYLVGKRAAVPDGDSVTLVLDGPLRRTLHVLVDGRARVVPRLDGPATASLTLPSGLFTRLCGGRVEPDERALAAVRIDGDQDLGRRVAGSLRFTI